MATAWTPVLDEKQTKWLLTNGEVVKAPALEKTPSGRKVRVVGTTISGYSKDLNEVVRKGVENVAEARGARIWYTLDTDTSRANSCIGFPTDQMGAQKLHLLGGSQQNGASTRLWWKFVHPDLPLDAVLVVQVQTGYAHGTNLAPLTVKSFLAFQLPDAVAPWPLEMARAETGDFISAMRTSYMPYSEEVAVSNFLRNTPPEVSTLLMEAKTTSERQAVAWYLDLVRRVDDLESIELPDLRDPLKPEYVKLNLHSTNVNGEIVDTMIQYLDGAPTLHQAATHYAEMLKCLRQTGMVFDSKTENDFLTAMLAPEGEGRLEVQITPNGEDGKPDNRHKLTLDLTNGTIVTSCSDSFDPETAAHEYQEAALMASLTGQPNELLAYVRASTTAKNKRRATKIIKQRQGTELLA